ARSGARPALPATRYPARACGTSPPRLASSFRSATAPNSSLLHTPPAPPPAGREGERALDPGEPAQKGAHPTGWVATRQVRETRRLPSPRAPGAGVLGDIACHGPFIARRVMNPASARVPQAEQAARL